MLRLAEAAIFNVFSIPVAIEKVGDFRFLFCRDTDSRSAGGPIFRLSVGTLSRLSLGIFLQSRRKDGHVRTLPRLKFF